MTSTSFVEERYEVKIHRQPREPSHIVRWGFLHGMFTDNIMVFAVIIGSGNIRVGLVVIVTQLITLSYCIKTFSVSIYSVLPVSRAFDELFQDVRRCLILPHGCSSWYLHLIGSATIR